MPRFNIAIETSETVTRIFEIDIEAKNYAAARKEAQKIYESGRIKDSEWQELERSVADVNYFASKEKDV